MPLSLLKGLFGLWWVVGLLACTTHGKRLHKERHNDRLISLGEGGISLRSYYGMVGGDGGGSNRQEEKKPKIFFLGPHKTGTESFHNFMKAHGYHSVHAAERSCQTIGLLGRDETFKGDYEGDGEITDIASLVEEKHLAKFRRYVRGHDVFTDTPWFLLYKLADKEFPGSKFILATRDTDAWLNSQRKYFGKRTVLSHKWIYGYGTVADHEDRYREVYEQHARDVLEYFGRDRIGKDLVVFRLGEDSNEDVTEMLNGFLGLAASKGIQMGVDHATKPLKKRLKPFDELTSEQ